MILPAALKLSHELHEAGDECLNNTGKGITDEKPV